MQLGVATRGSRIAQGRLAARLRLLYEQGSVEPLDIVFGAKSLDEALTNIDNWSSVAGQSEDVLRELKTRPHRAHVRLQAAGRTPRPSSRPRRARHRRPRRRSKGHSAARTAYISALATQRRLNAGQISQLVAQAGAAQRRSVKLAQVTPAAAPASSPAAADLRPPGAAGNAITVSATGYSLSGTTATGLQVGYGVVAVDPSVIPLGTHMTIPGYGEAVAADTGGAVSGR